MGHYETLGVDPEASVDVIRRSYLELARREHPDLHNESAASRSLAEKRMRSINVAWSVLSVIDERAAYDHELRNSSGRSRSGRTSDGSAPRVPGGNRPEPDWTPYDTTSDHVEFDERWDRPITSGGLPSWLAVAPVLLFMSGLLAVVGGSLMGAPSAAALGVVALIVSVVLFLCAPLVALSRSRRGDRLG